MKNLITKIAIFPIAIFFFAIAVKAQENFNLNSITASDIEFSDELSQKGLFSATTALADPPICLEGDRIKPGNDDSDEKIEKEWTVMVFMNAKNDLSESHFFGLFGKWAVKDIKEMKKVGTTEKVNVVVEHGIAGKGSKRILIKKKSGLLSSGEKVYGKYPDADMGDYKRVAEFVKWAKTEFPAKRYMLVLWNHGLGWMDPNLSEMNAGTGTSNKGILFDSETKNYVRTKELGEMMKQSGYVDVFVSNACLMQMAEVAYEIKDYTGLIVGSEETMLAYGFDYEKLLNFMNSNVKASNSQMSDFFINWYKEFYANGINIGPVNIPTYAIAATLSTLEPKALNQLPVYLSSFAKAAMDNNEEEAIKYAIQNAIRFTSIDPPDYKKMLSSYTDLYDFIRLAAKKANNHQTVQAAENLMNFIQSSLVLRSVGINKDTINGYNYSEVGGIAIETTRKTKKDISSQLSQAFETKYSDLSLSKASLWDEFISWSNKVWLK
ncbi:MAG: clostripain-related cysteine peptidase [Elusimicrobia bacterium]|nr:clostripain-related cysteine peptidase [Elusimicrobiota bacterium]